MWNIYQANIYLLKFNNKNTRNRSEICSELAIKIPEGRHWRRSGVFIVNFEHISHRFLVSVVEFKQAHVSLIITRDIIQAYLKTFFQKPYKLTYLSNGLYSGTILCVQTETVFLFSKVTIYFMTKQVF